MLDHGANVRHVQAMLGHADLSTTEIYTRVSIRKLKQVHQATHPARMGPPRGRELTGPSPDELFETVADEAFEEKGPDG